jgi:hypothetical protein
MCLRLLAWAMTMLFCHSIAIAQQYPVAIDTFRQASAADQSHNYVQAMQLWMKILREGSGITYTNPDSEAKNRNEILIRTKAEYYIGYYNELGLGVPQDYRQAAYWYQKSLSNQVFDFGANFRLGMLYAWGRGVPQDRQRARALFTAAQQIHVVELLDANALPENPDDVKAAISRLASENKQKVVQQKVQQEVQQENNSKQESAAAAAISNSSTAQILICPQPNAPHPFIVTIDSAAKIAQIEWASSTTSTQCIFRWMDGAYGPVAKGPTVNFCMLFSDNGNRRQTVKIDGSQVVVSDSGGGGFSLNLTTGIMRNDNGIEECHRPHS